MEHKLSHESIPSIHFYDQDFVDLYDRSWVWIGEHWAQGTEQNGFSGNYVACADQKTFNAFDSCLSALYLNYSNQTYSPFDMLDFFYSKQEESGAIRSDYSIEDGKPVVSEDNPEGVAMPLFAYVEYVFYHKIGNKKRLKDIVPVLENYFNWLKTMFQKENGLFSVPVAACLTGNTPRERTVYPVDFNTMVALNALYLSNIGDILNDKELSFRYKRLYFSLKTRINNLMWDPETHFYYDLDEQEMSAYRSALRPSKPNRASYSISDELFDTESSIIRDAAALDSCIIVGRCGDYILRDHPRRLSVYLYASMEKRIEYCMTSFDMDAKASEKKIREIDQARSNYRRRYTSGLGEQDLQDMMLDSGRFGVQGTAEIIADTAKKLFF